MPSRSAATNGPRDAAEPADRDHDQEIDQLSERIARNDRKELGAERAAERGEPAAEREGEVNSRDGIDADRLRHAQIVDGGADLRAEAGALEPEPQRRHQHRAAQR